MDLSLSVLIILIAVLYGCRHTPKTVPGTITSVPIQVDTTNKEIYDFMKEIIVLENMDLAHGLETEPDQNCSLQEPDSEYLNHFLIESKKAPPIKTENGAFVQTIDMFDRCLTKDDISFMLSQKITHRGFKWNISRLGFNTENRNFWHTFSIPLFSRDSTRVIMMIRDLCPGLCGTGNTVLFKKENNKWLAKTSDRWWH